MEINPGYLDVNQEKKTLHKGEMMWKGDELNTMLQYLFR